MYGVVMEFRQTMQTEFGCEAVFYTKDQPEYVIKSVGGLHMALLEYSSDVYERYISTDGFYLFTFLLSDDPLPIEFKNQQLTLEKDELYVLGDGGSLSFYNPPGCKKLLIKVPSELLMKDALMLGLRPTEGNLFDTYKYQVEELVILKPLIEIIITGLDSIELNDFYVHLRCMISCLLFKDLSHNTQPFYLTTPCVNKVVEKVKGFVLANPKDKASIKKLARVCHMSEKNLYRVFDNVLQVSVGDYVRKLRMEIVHEDIKKSKGNVNITDIAIDYGYTNQGRFSKQYKDYFGERPIDTLRSVRLG